MYFNNDKRTTHGGQQTTRVVLIYGVISSMIYGLGIFKMVGRKTQKSGLGMIVTVAVAEENADISPL